MPHDIHDILTLEVKKELADRYFGFRKLIEDDSLALADQIRQHSFILEKRISFDLIRIYILLKDQGLIHEFLNLTELNEGLFYDPYLTESPTIRQRVFEGQQLRGFTRASRFRNLIFDCYDRLTSHVHLYREKYAELEELQSTISDEIALFYRQHDLGSIMGFMRSLGDPAVSGGMAGGMETDLADGLAQRLKISAPPPIAQYLPIIPPLPELATLKPRLRELASRAYPLQNADFFASFTGRRR
ncbi:MAG: hypothetical protein COZ12_08750 [Deltaproteobacteria bacterium CG_4_10_14_3_um_filter_60_8]|nr:MAG: hypothetical protein AUK28_08145 [Desulfobacterales bacterium CG2_30_60_27]PIP43800.1 MAG: hypothetical protein COX17_05000 [Deltaproteobacteria bacterium CG23_combo_of_CG06-09_8_20_14_all_60_8]PIY20683.1 MAG: hypothetical protein COZ12_08750 [Deltaproteobacteria bacterium CG_4_10_14_3_um_filter_60_8]